MTALRRLAWTIVPIAVLLLGAVPAAASAPQQQATPERVAAAVDRLDALAGQLLERTGVPGMSVAVVYRDEVLFVEGFGVRVTGTDARVNADTVFQLASLSKPVASTVVAAVAGDGVVAWDDPIVRHDPSFAMHEPWVTSQVTLADLFAHRSGLPDHAGDLLEDIGYDREAILHRLRYLTPAGGFRASYNYTNFGLTAAAVAAAQAAGMTWEDLAAERLYRPLGMTSTSSRFADYAAASNRALTHAHIDGRFVAKYTRDADAQSPAGGVSSTARDLAQWLRLQLGGGVVDGRRIVAAETLAATHSPQSVIRQPADPATQLPSFYGLGWNVSYDAQGRLRLGHSGAFSLGAGTAVFLVPAEQLGIVVLTNGAPIGVAEALGLSFLDLALEGDLERDYFTLLQPTFDALNTPPYGIAVDYSKPRTAPSPAMPLEAYTGTYANDFFGEIEVTEANGGLVLHLGPAKTPYPMWHWDRDVFLYQPTGENAYGPSAITFEIGPDGRAVRLIIENLDIHDAGTFARGTATNRTTY